MTPATAFASEVTEAEAVVEESVLEEGADVSDPEENTGEETAGRVIGEGTETGNPDSSAFSVEGNAEIVDHITDGSTKEFYTIRTANNNTFYLVIDHSNATNNVYMLSAIDENDLKDFIEDENEEITSGVALETSVVEEEAAETIREDDATSEPEEQNQENEKEERNNGNLARLVVMVVCVALLSVAFLLIRKKHSQNKKEGEEEENIEYGYLEQEEDSYEPDNEEIDTEDDFEDMEAETEEGADTSAHREDVNPK